MRRRNCGDFASASKAIGQNIVPFIVTESCIVCKYTDCVTVCPSDAFREGSNFLAIDPDDCIDRTLCVAECPVEAIYKDCDVPRDQAHFTVLNAELAGGWTPILQKIAALRNADEWAIVKLKFAFLGALVV